MFIVPELLWSPVGNLIYEFSQNSGQPYRNNFLMNMDNIGWLNWVLLIQALGLLFLVIFLWKNFKRSFLYCLAALLVTILMLIVFYLFYISITLGRHGIS